jgi:hypothetical protein
VNLGNNILLYFDEAMDEGEWSIAGYNATQRVAAVVNIDENPDFAKLFNQLRLPLKHQSVILLSKCEMLRMGI